MSVKRVYRRQGQVLSFSIYLIQCWRLKEIKPDPTDLPIALRAHALRLQVQARRAEIEELARRGEPVDDLRRETAALRDSFRQIENDCAELQLQELLLAKERASYDATLKQMTDSETEWMPSLLRKDPPTAPRHP